MLQFDSKYLCPSSSQELSFEACFSPDGQFVLSGSPSVYCRNLHSYFVCYKLAYFLFVLFLAISLRELCHFKRNIKLVIIVD